MIKSCFENLKQNRLKITPKRKAVIGLFIESNQVLSPYQVHARLKRRFARLGLPTIYRILDELARIGILVKAENTDRQLSYGLCRISGTHHHHFICRRCKRIEELEYCDFVTMSRIIEEKLNCKAETHFLQIEGLCSKCR